MKKRDLLVTLLYFLDTVVLTVSVMFSVWMRNEFKLSALTKELTRGSFWTSMVLLAVVYACSSPCRELIRCFGNMRPCATFA